MGDYTIATVDSSAALEEHGLWCVKNRKHPGHVAKSRWLAGAFARGTRLMILRTAGGVQAGFLEYAPGESTWRAVEAPDHLVIHCLWVASRKFPGTGMASTLIEACVGEARAQGRTGVAVLSGDRTWLAGPGIFLKNGFEVVDEVEPGFQLLARSLAPGPRPSLPRDWSERAKRFKGLTLVYTNQCPFIGKAVEELPPVARDYGIDLHLLELHDPAEARKLVPTPYGVVCLVREGRVLADHPISATRFRNILERELGLVRVR